MKALLQRYLLLSLLAPLWSLAQEQKYAHVAKAADVPVAIQSIRQVKQGHQITLWMNNRGGFGLTTPLYLPSPFLEYPVGSGIEHLYGAAPLIGAIVVDSSRPDSIQIYRSVTQAWGPDGISETTPVDTNIWRASKDIPNGMNRRGYDDDGDGKIDEDELDGSDNDADGKIDEDYGAVSDDDIYLAYTDTLVGPGPNASHRPLGIKVWQRSYSWKSVSSEPILPIEYHITNIGTKTLEDVYIGFYCDFDVFPLGPTDAYEHNYAGMFPEVHTVFVHNPVDRLSTPIGLSLLDASPSPDSLQYSFHWWHPGFESGEGDDSLVYGLLACADPFSCVFPNGSPTDLGDVVLIYGFGPFRRLMPGDTLSFTVAFVSGDYLSGQPNSLVQNALKAIQYKRHNYTAFPYPPSPPLRVKREGNGFKFDWLWRPGDSTLNPLEAWDDDNEYIGNLPETSWRRRNPPAGHSKGGRLFGGFNLWRSVSVTGQDTNWTLAGRYLTDDYPNPAFGWPLQFAFTDTNLRVGNHYGYAVTSFSFPEAKIIRSVDQNGNLTNVDTLFGDNVESDIADNATFMRLSFTPSTKFGEVKVVPNPYRGDIYYTDGNGYEGDERTWTPDRRVIWFTHLPSRATIRIYTVAGEVIATIEHDDGARSAGGLPVGQEEWRLFSESGRPIASGIYLFSVESEFGKQVGKFVIIL